MTGFASSRRDGDRLPRGTGGLRRIRTRQRGLTLVEAMIVVTIVAILVGVAIPSFSNLGASNRRSAVIGELSVTFLFARNEAVSRRQVVSVCPSTDGLACRAGAAPDWNSGWIVFLDANGDGARDAGDQLLRVEQLGGTQFTLVGAAGLETGITYGTTGYPRNTGTMSYCDATNGHFRRLTLTRVGRVDIQELTSCA